MLNHTEQIGKLDCRITFQKKVIASNESNEDAENGWENIQVNPGVFASKDENTGIQEYEADKLVGVQIVTFICRFRTDLDIEMRILLNDLAYRIISISEVSRKRFLEIKTQTGQQYREEMTT